MYLHEAITIAKREGAVIRPPWQSETVHLYYYDKKTSMWVYCKRDLQSVSNYIKNDVFIEKHEDFSAFLTPYTHDDWLVHNGWDVYRVFIEEVKSVAVSFERV